MSCRYILWIHRWSLSWGYVFSFSIIWFEIGGLREASTHVFNTGPVVCTPCGTGTYYGSTGIYLLLSFIYTGLYCHLRLLFLLLFICISLYCHLESTLAYSWGNVELNFARPTRGHKRNMQPREKERWMGIPKALAVFNGRRFLLCCLCRLSSWIIFRF